MLLLVFCMLIGTVGLGSCSDHPPDHPHDPALNQGPENQYQGLGEQTQGQEALDSQENPEADSGGSNVTMEEESVKLEDEREQMPGSDSVERMDSDDQAAALPIQKNAKQFHCQESDEGAAVYDQSTGLTDLDLSDREQLPDKDGQGDGTVVRKPGSPGQQHQQQQLHASGDGLQVENKHVQDETEAQQSEEDKEWSLKKEKNTEHTDLPSSEDKTHTVSDQSKEPEYAESLPQTSSLPPPLEFKVFAYPGVEIDTYSNLHPSHGFVRSTWADEILLIIHDIEEFNQLNERRRVSVRGIYDGVGIHQANRNTVYGQLGNLFDVSNPVVYHDASQTYIQLPVPFSEVSHIAGDQQFILEVQSSPSYLVYYNPLSQHMWIVFHAPFSDLKKEFCRRWLKDFHDMTVEILNYLLNGIKGPILAVNTVTFLILIRLLFWMNDLLNFGSAFDAVIRNLLVNNNVNNNSRRSETYRQPPSSHSASGTVELGNSCRAKSANGTSNEPIQWDKAMDFLLRLKYMFDITKVVEKLDSNTNMVQAPDQAIIRPPQSQSSTHTAVPENPRPEPETSLGASNVPEQQINTLSTPQQPQEAADQLDIHQTQGESIPRGVLPDPPSAEDDPRSHVSLPAPGQGASSTQNNKTSQNTGPKKVSRMTQSKTEDGPSGA